MIAALFLHLRLHYKFVILHMFRDKWFDFMSSSFVYPLVGNIQDDGVAFALYAKYKQTAQWRFGTWLCSCNSSSHSCADHCWLKCNPYLEQEKSKSFMHISNVVILFFFPYTFIYYYSLLISKCCISFKKYPKTLTNVGPSLNSSTLWLSFSVSGLFPVHRKNPIFADEHPTVKIYSLRRLSNGAQKLVPGTKNDTDTGSVVRSWFKSLLWVAYI